MDMDWSWVRPVSSAIATSITTTFSVVSTVTLYALHIVIWPISILYGAFLAVFAPVIYTLQFIFAPFLYLLSFTPNLKPLYLYVSSSKRVKDMCKLIPDKFGSAAFVGIIAGLILQLTSTTFVSLLGMQHEEEEGKKYYRLEARPSMKLLDDASSQDSDWQWLERTTHPSVKRQRRTPGLTAQTILEEDDDSE